MLLILSSFAILANALDLVTVTTDLGDIQGFHVDYGSDTSQLYYGSADIFLGIPYVEPPLGDLRFAKPKPITKFPQPLINATSWKPACPQAEPCGTMKAAYDEDCLYLNVFAPNGSRTPANKAVMVFIHGGSFDSGCAQEYPYKGGVRTFVSQDVIVVTIQYRLGFWGFFTTLTDEYPANRGLLDQIEALKWVQNNIAKFGGDPKKVTIFGESAGSASVSAHSFSPLSRGLFAQTIQESGAMLSCLKTISQSVEQAGKLCGLTPAQFNGNDFSSLAPCLKNKTTADILQYDEAWNMVFDNNFLNDTLENLGKKRPNLPAILGNMRDEYTYFILHRFYADLKLEDMTRSFVEWTFRSEHQYMGEKIDEILAILEQTLHPKPIDDNDNVGWTKLASDMYTGQIFSSLMQQEVDFYLANNSPNVYLWEQSYASNVGRIYRLPGDWDPVPHCAELFFMWIPEDEWTRAINASEVIPFDWEVANWYSKTWTTFAKTGKPTMDNSWTAVTKDANLYWRLDKREKRGMQMGDSWREADSMLWNRVFPSILAQPPATTQPSTAPTDSTKTSIQSFRIFNIVLVLVFGFLTL